MTAIAACSRSPAARRRSTPAPGSTGPTNSPRSPRRRARSSARARCSTARSSRSTTRAIPASPRSSRRSREGGRGLTLFLFDALEIDGENLEKLPNIERKQRLAALLGEGQPPFILYADHIIGKGEQLVRGDVRGRPGRDHLEEGRRALSPRADEELAQGQMHAPAGIRDHRLERERQEGPRLPRAAARPQRGAASCATPARSAPASRRRCSTICARSSTSSRPRRRRPRSRAPRRAARIG